MTRIDIAEVTHFLHQLRAENEETKTYIASFQQALMNYVGDRSLRGSVIDSSKLYFSTVYFQLSQSIVQALNVAESSLSTYITDFHDQVDPSPSAKLDMEGLMDLEEKIQRYERRLDQVMTDMNNISHTLNNGNSASRDYLSVNSTLISLHKKEDILRKYVEFERKKTNFSQELADLAAAVQSAVNDIQSNLGFDAKTGQFNTQQLHAERFEKLMELYAKQAAIDEKVKSLEEIGLTPYVPAGNAAGFVSRADGTLDTAATLAFINQQMVYWQNETAMRELFGVGSFYRAIYGIDAVTGQEVGKTQRFMDGTMAMSGYGLGLTGFVRTYGLYSSEGIRVIGGNVGGKVFISDYKTIRKASVHNVDTNSITLGKYTPTIENGIPNWGKAGPDSYIGKAGTNSMYFDLGNSWDNIQTGYKLTGDEMFRYLNVPALDDAVRSGKQIRFSHDPRLQEYKDSYLHAEWEYLQKEHGFNKLIEKDGMWYGIK